MAFWAYMLRCADGTYYVGQTQDLDARVWHHQSGVVRGYTFSRRPVELVWSEAFEERVQAMEAERVLIDNAIDATISAPTERSACPSQ